MHRSPITIPGQPRAEHPARLPHSYGAIPHRLRIGQDHLRRCDERDGVEMDSRRPMRGWTDWREKDREPRERHRDTLIGAGLARAARGANSAASR
jgi:hypothetical protein